MSHVMAGGANHRHRVGVLPGLPGTSSSPYLSGSGGRSPLPDIDSNHNRQLVPLNAGSSELRSNNRDGFSLSQMQNVVNKIAMLEEANRAMLEEVYRLQTSVRATQLEKKSVKADEKKLQHELMQTIRASNDVVAELTSRMRHAEEKLHIDKETRKNMSAQTKQFEQALLNTQHEYSSQREKQKSQISDLRHKIDEMLRKHDRSERTSATLVDEFRQMKTKLEIQAMDFTHLQTELRQRSKRLEEDTKQAMLATKFQKDNHSQAEQATLQTRQFFEVRINELRDAITDMRNRIGRAESESHSYTQQTNVKLNELHSSINDQSHKRQEDIQALERNRQEQGHLEENERMKLQGRIKEAVEEMSDKLLSKEVRLREEALQKFVQVERLVQKEESHRVQFEKQMREDNEARWDLQQKLLQDEVKAVKESRRTDLTKNEANGKRIDETMRALDRKLQKEKKSLEKVLLAEITKREKQSANTLSKVDEVQEQLRVALSTLQQAIGGLQFQMSRDKEQFSNEIKTQLSEEHIRVSRAISDTDTRLTALSARITQQDETYDVKINEMSSSLRDKQTELRHDFQEWRENTNKDMSNMQLVLNELPQEMRETQERVTRLKDEANTRIEIDNEARRVDAESTESKIRMLAQRTDTIDSIAQDDHTRIDDVQQQLAIVQGTLNQVTRTVTDVRTSHNVRLNSETKMRLEEASAIKKELARLRMEIQPLLWKQTASSRLFVKKETSVLNEWGVYQCARWFDIKMRWLRLLHRARRRRREQRVANERSRTPSPGLEFDTPVPSGGQGTPQPEPKDAWKSQSGTPNDLGLHGGGDRSPEFYDEARSPTSVRLDDDDDEEDVNPQAWYNQETVPTNLETDERENNAHLTQRIETPRRPSVPGSEDTLTPVDPATRSAAASRQSQQQPNSKRASSQNKQADEERASRTSNPPSTTRTNRQTSRNSRGSKNRSRQESQQQQNNGSGGYDLEGRRP